MICTERLELRLPTVSDVPAIAAYYADNQAHLQPWSPAWPPGFTTEAFWRLQTERAREEFEGGAGVQLFAHRLGDGALVGNLSLTQVARGPLQQCYLGYNLAASAQGQGYAREAVAAAVAYAFEELRLHRVSANYVPRNERSAGVLKRCGFRVEGLAPAYLLINGRWEDHVLTALTAPFTHTP